MVNSIASNKKDTLLRRLKIIEGQIKGLQRMVKQDEYCIDIITQTSSVKRALSSVEDILLEGHLSTCFVKGVKSKNKDETKRMLKEILEVYKIAKRK